MANRDEYVAKHPLPEGVSFRYGTAGFRTKGNLLDGVAFRMGLLMVRRARVVGKAVGVMVSASHNPGGDNGMKLVDGSGAMLAQEWEGMAENLANARTAEEVAAALKVVGGEGDTSPVVYVGRDTRSTGPAMVRALVDGIECEGGKASDIGVVTTPQLHYAVWKDTADMESYYNQAVTAFKRMLGAGRAPSQPIHVDCSNGVGFPRMALLAKQLEDVVEITLHNGKIDNPDLLNSMCGADFVQKEKKAPQGCTADLRGHLVSFDGDADRLVYFRFAPDFQLIDGDRIAVLYATLVKKCLEGLPGDPPKVGVVQTAYANGASTRYIKETLGLEVAMTPTGVKHLHHKALEYDIGIYFEANGHGTVLVSDPCATVLEKAASEGHVGAAQLVALRELVSPVCGDAMLDLLLCEAALVILGWDVSDWAALYTDAPSTMTKVTVKDPQVVKTVWDQTRVTHPEALQIGIDTKVGEFSKLHPSRAFVRPSGTEPILRVYAESGTQGDAEKLAIEIENVIKATL